MSTYIIVIHSCAFVKCILPYMLKPCLSEGNQALPWGENVVYLLERRIQSLGTVFDYNKAIFWDNVIGP